MILEGLITTVDAEGKLHLAPMGPQVSADMSRMTLRPFRGGRTFENLCRSRQGVFHIVDDVEMLAAAAVGDVSPPVRPAESVDGFVLVEACQALEIRVTRVDDGAERSTMEARVVRRESLRDFFGWNRGKHAVLEAAILATRVHLLPAGEINSRLASLQVLVDKTGGVKERRAFKSLQTYVDNFVPPATAGPRGKPPVGGVRVRGGARVHFGLIDPGGAATRRFGGAGLMVEDPPLEVTVERAHRLEVVGSLAQRATEFARRFTGQDSPPYRIGVSLSRPDHVGLGTGTQLGLAVARGIASLEGDDQTTVDLALRVGRGRRSAVGVHGFERGGVIVEAGKKSDPSISPLLGRYRFPLAWRVVLMLPRGQQGVSGLPEENAFGDMDRPGESVVDKLSRLLLLGIIPGLVEADLDTFGEALYEYGYRSGEIFSRCQSSAFATPEIAAVARFLRSEGVRGVGQSSWGPAVFAIVDGDAAATRVVQSLTERFRFEPEDFVVTRGLDRGAEVASLREAPSLHTLA